MDKAERLGDANRCLIELQSAILRDKPRSQRDTGKVADCAATELAAAKGRMRDDGNVSDGATPDFVSGECDKIVANKNT